jgi:protein AroM
MTIKIGAITIGQSPRDDIIPDLKSLIRVEIPVKVCGILDGLGMEEIKKLAPGGKEDVLTTRLRDGSSVTLGYDSAVKGIRECLATLRSEGYEVIALLCSGHFSELERERGLIHPSLLIKAKVEEMIKRGFLGVLVPLPEQTLPSEKKWQSLGGKVVVASASPYGETKEILQAAESLLDTGVDLIVLDCIGYNISIYQKIKEIASIPILLPLDLLAHRIKKFIE